MFSFVSVLLNNIHCAVLNGFSRNEGAFCTLFTNLKCVAIGRMKFRAHNNKEAPQKYLVRNWMPNFKETGFVNPWTPELNPSEQGCLPEFFTGAFKF